MVPHSDIQRRVLELERQRMIERVRREHLADIAAAGLADSVTPWPNVPAVMAALGRRLAAAIDQLVLPLVWPRLAVSSPAARPRDGERDRPAEDSVAAATTGAT